MSVSLLLALAAQTGIPGPPPVFIPSARMMASPASRGPIVTLDVEVRGGGELLWSGQLRVTNRSGASFTRQQSSASPTICVADEYGDNSDRSSLSVNLTTVRQSPAGSGVEIRASWERPSDDPDCKTRRSTRTVGLVETILVEPGREQVVNGDGGLSIRVRRR